MALADKRRILAATAALAAMPFYCYCGLTHFCMDGHLAHPPHAWHDVANDCIYLTLLPIAFVFAFRADMPRRRTFVALTGLLILVLPVGEGGVGLPMSLALIYLGIGALVYKPTEQAPAAESDATKSPVLAPDEGGAEPKADETPTA